MNRLIFSLLCLIAFAACGVGTSTESTVRATSERLSVKACSYTRECAVGAVPDGADPDTSTCGPDGTCQWRTWNNLSENDTNPFVCVVGFGLPCATGSIPHGIKYCGVTADDGVGNALATDYGACTSNFTTSGVTATWTNETCHGNIDCAEAADIPVGTDWDTATCHPRVAMGTEYCVWEPMDQSHYPMISDANCVADTIRFCTTSGSAAGIQKCDVINASSTVWSTEWETCHT